MKNRLTLTRKRPFTRRQNSLCRTKLVVADKIGSDKISYITYNNQSITAHGNRKVYKGTKSLYSMNTQ